MDLLQWPAMALTCVGAWLVASRIAHRRAAGFWFFLAGNALWAIWGWHDHAPAVIGLQVFLAGLNVRGVWKNE